MRAGVANFGAEVTLGTTVLSCNAFDLGGEEHIDEPFTYDNLGNNTCGCPAVEGCTALSANLAPPEFVAEP